MLTASERGVPVERADLRFDRVRGNIGRAAIQLGPVFAHGVWCYGWVMGWLLGRYGLV